MQKIKIPGLFKLPLKKAIFPLVFIIFGNMLFIKAQQIKILPLGNSITWDSYVDDTRDDGERISYRYKLYQLLKADGLDFDFVGNRYAGYNFFLDAQVAGFPGITVEQMVNLINTGWNEAEEPDVKEAPSAYLAYYPADIVLLHIGTNDLVPGNSIHVEELLSRIRAYLPNAVILVARIINRKTYHPETKQYNDIVEAYVNGLGDSRIKMVDMENGAGIIYSTEMRDTWHPYQSAYDKMGVKWYQAIMAINNAPDISTIPKQITQEGVAFNNLDLKIYVTDPDQTSSSLTNWAFTYSSDPKINVSLNNGVASVSVLDSEWSGKDTVLFKVTDNGNGAFKKTDSVYVVYEVVPQNDPPVSNGIILTSIWEDSVYTFKTSDFDLQDIDSDLGDLQLVLNTGTNYEVVSANQIKPNKDYTGTLSFNIRVSDQIDTSEVYNYSIEVLGVNDPPVIAEQTVFPEVKEGAPLILSKSYIDIEDVDNAMSEVGLTILPGENYVIDNGIVYMNQKTAGFQFVKLQLFDSKDSSEIFNFMVSVLSAAKPPVFVSSPITTADENSNYEYFYNAVDSNGDEITYKLERHPDFIQIDLVEKKVYGTPGRDDIGVHLVEISAKDDVHTVYQKFNLEVINVNDEPYFISTANTSADDYELYAYEFSGKDDDLDDTLVFFPEMLPDWLSFDEDQNQVNGYPKWTDADKIFNTKIGLTDGKDTVFQSFNIFVSNNNSLPVLNTFPDTSVYVDSFYIFNLDYSDKDEDDVVQLTLYDKPEWLIYDSQQVSFYGKPTNDDAGINRLVFVLNDGRSLVSETFEINVLLNTKSNNSYLSIDDYVKIYPNPAFNYLRIELVDSKAIKALAEIYSINGSLLKQFQLNTSTTILELGDLQSGFYQIVIDLGEIKLNKKLIVR